MVPILLGDNFNIDQKNTQEHTVLHLAIFSKNISIFNLVMEQWPDLKVLDGEDKSYLELALFEFDKNICSNLLASWTDKIKVKNSKEFLLKNDFKSASPQIE